MDKLIDVPGQGVVAFPDSMSDAEIEAVLKRETATQPEVRGTVERFAEPFVETGKGLLSLAKGGLEAAMNRPPRNFKGILEDTMGITAARSGAGLLKGLLQDAKAGADKEAQDFNRSAPERLLRTAVASVPLAGQGLLSMGDKIGEGNLAGAAGEAVLNFSPAVLGKLGKLKRLKGEARAVEQMAAAKVAANTPTGKMVEELGGTWGVTPEVTAQRAAKIAEEELAKLGARGGVAAEAGSPAQLKASLKARLDERNLQLKDEAAKVNQDLVAADSRFASQTAAEASDLKGKLMAPFPEKFTPTEAGKFAVPELKSRLDELKAKFPEGTKGYERNVAPLERGAPGRAISLASKELASRATKIPLEDAQQWQMLMKTAAGDPDAVRAIRSDFVFRQMGGGKSADDFAAKLRSTPPDTVYAVLGPDAAPTYRILDRLDELTNRNQNMAPRGGQVQPRQVAPTQRLEVLEQALDEIGKGRAGKGLFGKFLSAAGFSVQSRVLRLLPILTAQGSPQSVLRFWRAFDVFTRNGYAPAFIQTVNAIERRTREEEQRNNGRQETQ